MIVWYFVMQPVKIADLMHSRQHMELDGHSRNKLTGHKKFLHVPALVSCTLSHCMSNCDCISWSEMQVPDVVAIWIQPHCQQFGSERAVPSLVKFRFPSTVAHCWAVASFPWSLSLSHSGIVLTLCAIFPNKYLVVKCGRNDTRYVINVLAVHYMLSISIWLQLFFLLVLFIKCCLCGTHVMRFLTGSSRCIWNRKWTSSWWPLVSEVSLVLAVWKVNSFPSSVVPR